jgi:dihydroorotate dehydrogenase electron transfer subunit
MLSKNSKMSNLHENSGQLASVFECEGTVVENRLVNDEYRHLVLIVRRDALAIMPGQFFHIQCPQGDGAISYLRRPMSIYHFDQEAGKVEFLYKVHGKGTRAMSVLEKGHTINIFGPLGRGFWLEDSWQHLVLVARGVGLATLAPLARYASERGKKLTAICSARAPNLLMSLDLFRSYGAEIIPVTDHDGSSSVENLEVLIDNLIVKQGIDAFYTCGSNRILKLLQKLCKREGIAGQTALEQQMACGIGMCFCCVRPFNVDGKIIHRRVCNEGPVFNLMESQPW